MHQPDLPPLSIRHLSLVFVPVVAPAARPAGFLRFVSAPSIKMLFRPSCGAHFAALREFCFRSLTCLFFLPLPLTTCFHRRIFDPSTPSRGGGGWPAKTSSTAGGAGGIPGRGSWIGAVAASKVFFGPSPGVKGVRRLAQSSRTNINNHPCPPSPAAGDPTFPLIGREKGPYARRSHRPAFH